MKKNLTLVFVLLTVLGCKDNTIEKPNNLIEKDKMIAILYDISLLDAIKSQGIQGGMTKKQENEYLYKKYNIDSAQFTNSNKFYASDIEEYQKMFETIKNRLTTETQLVEKKLKKNGGVTPSESINSSNPNALK